MREVVLDDDDPVYINVKKMPTFADLLQKVSVIIINVKKCEMKCSSYHVLNGFQKGQDDYIHILMKTFAFLYSTS